MGYSEDPSMLQVDFFKPSGKYYTTEAVKWTAPWAKEEIMVTDGFKQSLRDHFDKEDRPDRLSDMIAICLEPYHELAIPQLLQPGTWQEPELAISFTKKQE